MAEVIRLPTSQVLAEQDVAESVEMLNRYLLKGEIESLCWVAFTKEGETLVHVSTAMELSQLSFAVAYLQNKLNNWLNAEPVGIEKP